MNQPVLKRLDEIKEKVNYGSNQFFLSRSRPDDPIAALGWENARDYWNRRLEIIERLRKQEGDR